MKRNIKKEMLLRGLLGFPLGIAIGSIITIIISLVYADGRYYPVVSSLIDKVGGELNAVILQTVLCGIIGVGFSMGSVIWMIDSWSIAKQSGLYFLVGLDGALNPRCNILLRVFHYNIYGNLGNQLPYFES